MVALYSLADEYISAFNKLSETGFDHQTIEDTLAPLEQSFEEKAKSVTCWMNNLESEIEELEKHKENILSRIKARKSEVEFYREYIKNNMIRMNIKSIKCPLFDITVKNTIPKLIKEDEMLLPSEYIKTKIVTDIDNKKLKDDLMSGLLIPGAYLQESYALTIKLK